MAAKIVFESTYRASDGEHNYRVVRDGVALHVEVAMGSDRMGQPIWDARNNFNTRLSLEGDVLGKLLEKAGL